MAYRTGTGSRIYPLVPADLHRLPTCSCDGVAAGAEPRWARAAMVEWGMCGVAIVVDGRTIGHLLVSPPLHVPRSHPLHSGVNFDAAALLRVSVVPGHRGHGYGRQLVQSCAARLVGRRRLIGLDAWGSRSDGRCTAPPAAFLESVGFHPLPHDARRLRLDLDTTRTLPDLTSVLARLRTIVHPMPPPEPTGRVTRQML